MKTTRFGKMNVRAKSVSMAVATATLLLASLATAWADLVAQIQNADNDTTYPHWNTAALWDGGLAPSASNDYVTTAGLAASSATELGVSATVTGRVRENGTTFGGNSFRIASDTELLMKQFGGETTSGNVILEGGILRLAPNGNGSAVLAGTLQVDSNSVVGVVQSSSVGTALNITSTLSGSADLRLAAGSGTNHVVSFQGDLSAYSGTINVGGGFQRVTVNFADDYVLPNLSLAYGDFATADLLDLTHNITVGAFSFDGTSLSNGTYTAAQLNADFGDGNQFQGAGTLTVIPEPSIAALLLLGFTALCTALRRKCILSMVAIISVIVALPSIAVRAATINFNVADGYWDNAANWSPASIPTVGDEAWVGSASRTLRVNTTEAADYLYVPAGHVVIESGANVTIGSGGVWMRGVFGDASFTMSGGQLTVNGNYRFSSDESHSQSGGSVSASRLTVESSAAYTMSGSASIVGGTGGSGSLSGQMNLSGNASVIYNNFIDVSSSTAVIELADQSSFTSDNQIRNNGGTGTMRFIGNNSTASVTQFGTTSSANKWTFEYQLGQSHNMPSSAQAIASGTQSLNHNFTILPSAGIGHDVQTSMALMRAHDFSNVGSETLNSGLWDASVSGSVGDKVFSAELTLATKQGTLAYGEDNDDVSFASSRLGWVDITGVGVSDLFRLQFALDDTNPTLSADKDAFLLSLIDAGYTVTGQVDAGYEVAVLLQGKTAGDEIFYYDLDALSGVSEDFSFTGIGVSSDIIPEPGTVTLLVLGLLLVGRRMQRR